uniref:Gustatory receptor n=1 Tax=Lutzomyia longipalpis TaxID=7200 RepID=A0A240SXS6_LUTLO
MAHLKLGRKLFLCFQLCGLSIINLSILNKDRKDKKCFNIKNRLIHILHIVVLSVNFAIVQLYPNAVMSASDSLGKFNDWIKYYAAVVTSFTILLESYIHADQLICIFNQTSELDGIFAAIRVDLSQRDTDTCRVYMRKFIFLTLMLLVLELWPMSFFLTNTPMLNYWLLTTPFLVQSRFRQLQHILYIDLCHHYARVLACNAKQLAIFLNSLETTTTCSGMSLEKYPFAFVHHRFRMLQKSHHIIWKISNCINQYFGWSQVANYSFHFLQILADCYWLYWRIYNKSYGIGLCDSCLGTVITQHENSLTSSRCITSFAIFSSPSFQQVHSISIWLHRVKFTIYNGKISETLLNFSLQIIQEPVLFQTMELFTIDFKPLRSMISAITTYMVLFVQFLPRLVTSSYLTMD